jgi:hypothetical protein
MKFGGQDKGMGFEGTGHETLSFLDYFILLWPAVKIDEYKGWWNRKHG